MTTTIQTLIPDIQAILRRKDGWFDEQASHTFSDAVAVRLRSQLGQQDTGKPTLRLSQMGSRCPRSLWFSIHRPELREALPPWAEVKYTFGHIIEALAIELARSAGHLVTGEQDAVYVDGITGHRDCVIDGCVVDVKSTSSRGFIKFKDGSLGKADNFGYLDQLDGYLVGSSSDPLVSVKDKGYLFAIDKQLGHMCLYEHQIREQHIRERISEVKQIVERDSPPACGCGTVEHGKSGNLKLDTKASYNLFKYACFPHLRTFLYSDGPVFLAKVVKKPDVIEVDKNGKVVYN